MLADYVMRSIDSLFSDKLNGPHQARDKDAPAFHKETIKKSLHKVIRRQQPESPLPNHSHCPHAPAASHPLSPSKSTLRVFLETNREQRISSVLKGHKTSFEGEGTNRARGMAERSCNKENNVVKYYQEMRKSIQKSQERSKSPKRGLQLSKATVASSTLRRNASKRCVGGMRS